MSRIVSFIALSILALIAVAAVNIREADAREEVRFIQVSVLAEDQANYGVDKNLIAIPAVSADIIEDKVGDSAVPIIKYTSLPARDPKPARQDNDDTQIEDKTDVYVDPVTDKDKKEDKETKEDAKEDKKDKKDTKEDKPEKIK